VKILTSDDGCFLSSHVGLYRSIFDRIVSKFVNHKYQLLDLDHVEICKYI
jgi:hypothetical protein